MINCNDDQAMDVLDEATASLRESSVPEGPSPGLLTSTVERLQSSKISPDNVRLNERKKLMPHIVRYSGLAAAVTLLAVLVGSFWFVDRSASTVFADVIENVKKATSVSFVVKTRLGSRAEPEGKLWMLGDVVRYERPPRDVLIVDTSQRKGLRLNTARKVATEHDLVGAVPEAELMNPIDQLRNLTRENAERLGDELLDERNCHVYLLKGATVVGSRGDWKLWIDPKTALPVKMHIGDDNTSITFEQFRWNEPLDARLFKLEIPEGYSLVKEPPGPIETAHSRKPTRGDLVRGTAVGTPGRVAFAFHEFDAAAKTLSVRIRGTGFVIDGFRLAEDAQVVVHSTDASGNDATFTPTIDELGKTLYDAGVPVILDLAADGKVTRLESHWYDLDGLLYSVDASNHTITLMPRRGKQENETIAVLPDVRVLIDAKESKLADLKAAMPLALVTQLRAVKGDRRAVARIEATSLQIAGQVEAVDAAMSTVSVRGKQLAVKALPVARRARILIDGKESAMQDLNEGMHVSVQLQANPDHSFAIGIRASKGGDN